MKRYILFKLALLCLILFTASILQAGYRTVPWGSKTWTGPGRPPHWSPMPVKPAKTFGASKVVRPHWRSRQNSRSYGQNGFWKDRHNRWYYDKHRRSGYIYYKSPKIDKVIIEREKRIPVYIPVRKNPARLQCGGRTITQRDPTTGVISIEYVSSARDC